MKILNKAICLLVFFAVGQSCARVVGPDAPQQPGPNQPAPQRVPAPAPQPQGPQLTYKQLHDNILKESPTAAGMFTGNKFSEGYIAQEIGVAKAYGLGKEGLRALLQTARDKWASFTGRNDEDIVILRDINQQIDTAVTQMQ